MRVIAPRCLFRGDLAILVAALVSSCLAFDAVAGVPSPASSTCPTRVTAAPDGNCCFDVTVRDLANNPVPGSVVVVSFGACPLTFCPTQPTGIIVNAIANTARAVTDLSGHVHFCVCVSTHIGTCTPSISADGVLLCSGLTADSCPSDSSCVPEQWHAVGHGGPGARWGAAMAADYDYERVLLFGGTGASVLADTWRWDGLDWNLLSPVHQPGARSRAAMVYDRRRHRMVLFGGTNGAQFLGDTWEFDGTDWALASSSGPAARAGHGMAYDEARERVVLFGGENGGELGDTWEWDGAQWTQTAVTGPPARHDGPLAYDQASGLTMLYGGTQYGTVLGDMWVYGAAGWYEITLEPGNPGARTGHAMAFSPEGNFVVLYGGYGPGSDAATWAWKGGKWASTAPGVGVRVGPAMAYDHFNDHLMLFGGLPAPGAPFATDATDEWCSPCPFVAALLDSTGEVVRPLGADPDAWSDETLETSNDGLVPTLHPGVDTSNENWYGDLPCDPSFGDEPDSLDLAGEMAELGDSLGTPGLTEAEVSDSLSSWEARIEQMLANEPGPFADSLKSAGPYVSPSQSHCPDPSLKYAFGGRDIIFIHGLRMTPLTQRMFGTNDSAFVDWKDPAGDNGYTDNPDYYWNERYWKRGANNYWKPHIDRFLRAKGYANRFLVVSWPSTQRYETAIKAVLWQISDAMREGVGVIDSLSGHNDTSKFGTPDFVIISHSTGGPVSDIAMSAAAQLPSLQARYIADHCKAHIGIAGAFSGSAIATAAVGAGAVLSDNSPVWLCKLLESIFESNVPVCHNIAYLDTPIRGVTWDLTPLVSQVKWGHYLRDIPMRTVTVTGGHPSFQWPIKYLLLRGLDDGVLNANSTSANSNLRTFWPSGYERLGPVEIAGRAVWDRGLEDGPWYLRKVRRLRGYVHDQLLDPIRSLDPINILFPPPVFTRVATGCTDFLSPTGMVQPWHFKSRTGLLDPNNRYRSHYSFVESAADHYGATPNATDDVRDGGAIKQLQTFFPDNQYAYTFSLAGTEHNTEEVRVITDDGIYENYDRSGDAAPLLDRFNATVTSGITMEEIHKDKCFPKRKGKPCKVYRWRRTYNRLVGWESKLAADYAYDYLLTRPAETCTTGVHVGVPQPADLSFFARAQRNPFTNELLLDFRLPRAGTVTLDIHDMQGRRVRRVVAQPFAAGVHRAIWDGRGDGGQRMGPGVYLWRFRLDGQPMQSDKAVLLQ